MTEEHFYTRQEDILAELADRKSRRAEIAEKIDAFIFEKYGIENFCDLFYDFLGEKNWRDNKDLKSSIFLARAIPSFTIEDLYVDAYAKKYGLIHRALPLSCDVLIGSSPDKFSKIVLREYEKDDVVVALIRDYENLNSTLPISEIFIDSGCSVLDWHLSRRKNIFGVAASEKDLSLFLMRLFFLSKNKPQYIHLFSSEENIFKKVLKEYYEENVNSKSFFRPPVVWWYPMFFSLFCMDNVLYDDYTKQINNKESVFSISVFSSFCEVLSSVSLKPLILKENLRAPIYCSYFEKSINSFEQFVQIYKKAICLFKKEKEYFDETVFFRILKDFLFFKKEL